MNIISKASILVVAFAMTTPVYAQVCKVTDPTDTPLNVRDSPAGKVTGELPNGRVVYIADYDYDAKGNAWAMVFDAKTDEYIGWIFREFISCY